MNMMTTIIGKPLPPIALLRALPAGPLTAEYQRLQRLAELFAAFDRDDMEAGVELLMAEIDARDGDPDLEDGDQDRCAASDDNLSDIRVTRMGVDPDVPRDDDDCESSGWSEWDARGRHNLTSEGLEEQGTLGVMGSLRHEDEEDDDPRDVTVGTEIDQSRIPATALTPDDAEEDDPSGDRDPDREAVLSVPESAAGRWGEHHGTQWADDDEREPDDPAARRPHLRRLRRARALP